MFPSFAAMQGRYFALSDLAISFLDEGVDALKMGYVSYPSRPRKRQPTRNSPAFDAGNTPATVAAKIYDRANMSDRGFFKFGLSKWGQFASIVRVSKSSRIWISKLKYSHRARDTIDTSAAVFTHTNAGTDSLLRLDRDDRNICRDALAYGCNGNAAISDSRGNIGYRL